MSYKKSIKTQDITLKKVWENNNFNAPQIKIPVIDYQSINKIYLIHKTMELHQYMFDSEPENLRNSINNLLVKNLNFEIKGEKKGFESISICYLYLKCKIQDLQVNGYTLSEIALKQIDELKDDELGYIFYAVLLECKILNYTFDYSYQRVDRADRINLLKGKFHDKYLELTRQFVLDDILE